MYKFSTYKQQYRANLTLALPVILSQLGQIVVQFVDNMMVGQYGGDNITPLSAVSFGGSIYFIIFVACMGITFGLTPLIGELYAKGDTQRSGQYLFNGMVLYTGIGAVMTAVQLAVIPLMYYMGQPEDVVDMAIPYYKMLVYSMVPMMVFFSFKQFLEGIGNTKVAMVVVIVCNLMNVLLNWVFIYGNWGADEMGAEGAGLATMISRVAMAVSISIYFVTRSRFRRYWEHFESQHLTKANIRMLLNMGIPISAQMFLECSAFIVSGVMMGWFGSAAISANQIAITMGNAAFMIVVAVSAATTIRISHCYGANDFKTMKIAAHAAYHIGVAWNILAAIIFTATCTVMPEIFTSNTEVIALASVLLVLISIYQIPDGVQCVSVGVLRGMQDVKIIMPIAFLSYWVLNLPIGYLCAFTLGMGPQGIFVGYIFGLSAASILMIWRIRHKMRQLEATNRG